MKKHIKLLFAIMAMATACMAQPNNIVLNAGLAYTDGPPTFRPGAKGSRWAIDTVTFLLYESSNPSTSTWINKGYMVGTISGCSSPNYTPTKHQPVIVVNNCDSLYYYRGGAWRHLNAGGGGAGNTDISFSDNFNNTVDVNSSTGTGFQIAGSGDITVYDESGRLTIEYVNTGLSGAIQANQVAYGSGTNAIQGSNNLTFNGSKLALTGSAYVTDARIDYTSLGALWLYSNFPKNSHFFGGAGNLTATADRNIGFGREALLSVTTGGLNVAMGQNALRLNTTGTQNFALGNNVLQKNVTGTNNVGIGAYALAECLASSNVGIGGLALTAMTTGDKNVGVGTQALTGMTTGSSNTAIGYTAMLSNVGGVSNVAIGEAAMYAGASGNNNTVVGREAMYSGTGNNNVVYGRNAAVNLTTGSNNVIIGYNIHAPSATGSYQLNIGNLVFGAGLDGTGATLSSGRVSVGVAVPDASAKLEVASTTGGILFPRMTTTQRDAISSPTDGLVIFNTTAAKLQVRAGGAWVDLH